MSWIEHSCNCSHLFAFGRRCCINPTVCYGAGPSIVFHFPGLDLQTRDSTFEQNMFEQIMWSISEYLCSGKRGWGWVTVFSKQSFFLFWVSLLNRSSLFSYWEHSWFIASSIVDVLHVILALGNMVVFFFLFLPCVL